MNPYLRSVHSGHSSCLCSLPFSSVSEHLFILIHQTFELWFKQILWELEYVRNCMIGYRDPLLPASPSERNPLARCVQRVSRADKIMRLATEGYGIMESMDPADFLEFRDFLSPSSGFQSVQLREIEILLGLKDEERLACAGRHYREAFMANGDNKTPVFDRRLGEHNLKSGLYVFLRRHVPTTRLAEFLATYFEVINTQNSEKSKDFEEEMALLEKMRARTTDTRELAYLADLVEKAKFGRTLARNSSSDIKAFFSDPMLGIQRASILYLFTYHTHPSCTLMASFVNSFLLLEQSILLWRQRHARMVEMFIGRRPGTGGSSGVEYIDQTAAQYRIFTDLWRIRSLCVARSKLHFDPDQGAVVFDETTAQFETDYKKVEAQIRVEQDKLKEKSAAQAPAEAASADAVRAPLSASMAHAISHKEISPPSNAAADGPLANSATSIAAGIGPGAAVGQNAV
jgi:tryptophan 2,3-dioxygenase